MIFNPTVIAGGGGSSTELVSVAFGGGPTACYHYYSTIENGTVVLKTSSVPGQTIQAIKGSLIFAFALKTYISLLNAVGARQIFWVNEIKGSAIRSPDYAVSDTQNYAIRVYEATG